MLTRRTFIQSSLVILTVPFGGVAGAAVRSPVPVYLRSFSTCGCPDSEQFQEVFCTACQRIDHDVGGCLQQISSDYSQNSPSVLFGLTRDTDEVLISQLAVEQGYKKIYEGKHRYTTTDLHHSLRGSEDNISRMHFTLRRAGNAWPRLLAQNADHLISSVNLDYQIEVSLPASRPHDSPGYLVSWAYRKG